MNKGVDMIKKLTPIIAILAIAGLEVYAMRIGLDGAMLAIALCIISGLGGYEAKTIIAKVKK